MKTNNSTGRGLAVIIGLYVIVKAVVNMLLGDHNIFNIVYAVLEAAALYTGLMYLNYIVAGILALVVLMHLKTNLSDIGGHIIYLIEAAVDIVCAVLLIIQKDVKEHFTNKWSEIGRN